MRLFPELQMAYRCMACGALHDEIPAEECCQEPASYVDGGRLLTIEEVAENAQVSKATVSAWINKGDLPALREGRVVRVALSDYLDFVNRRTRSEG